MTESSPDQTERVVPAIEAVACDLSCLGCRYNLRSLRVSERCPECGQPVRETVDCIALMRRQSDAGSIVGLVNALTWTLGWMFALPFASLMAGALDLFPLVVCVGTLSIGAAPILALTYITIAWLLWLHARRVTGRPSGAAIVFVTLCVPIAGVAVGMAMESGIVLAGFMELMIIGPATAATSAAAIVLARVPVWARAAAIASVLQLIHIIAAFLLLLFTCLMVSATLLRRSGSIAGSEEISVGFWVVFGLTPLVVFVPQLVMLVSLRQRLKRLAKVQVRTEWVQP